MPCQSLLPYCSVGVARRAWISPTEVRAASSSGVLTAAPRRQFAALRLAGRGWIATPWPRPGPTFLRQTDQLPPERPSPTAVRPARAALAGLGVVMMWIVVAFVGGYVGHWLTDRLLGARLRAWAASSSEYDATIERLKASGSKQ